MPTKLAVLGCGYIGSTLINTFSKQYKIIGYDISEQRIDYLNKNCKKPNVTFTTDESMLETSNVYIICVPTDIDDNKKINKKPLLSAKNTILKYLKDGDMIVIESSIHVGGTRELFSSLLTQYNNISICFSSERISPGTNEDCSLIPKLVSGIDTNSLNNITTLYKSVIKEIIPVTSLEVAEMAKLYENCFRVINIAYVNEISDLCKYHKIDANEVIEAANTKPFGFMKFTPSFGVGGVCLTQNPYVLMNNLDHPDKRLPILSKSIKLLNDRPYNKAYKIQYKNIFYIGIGYKKNQAFTGFSPALTLYNELRRQEKNVFLYDLPANINSDFKFTLDNLLKYDCIVIGNPCDDLDYITISEFNKYKEVITF
jgi:nucleotide sugar dehydrogenase